MFATIDLTKHRWITIPHWWVEDGNNWCKTKWWYVLIGKHRGQKLKFD